jgi:hypothetical protein
MTYGRQIPCSWLRPYSGAKVNPRGRIFLTLGQKLREAALLSGFDVKMI